VEEASVEEFISLKQLAAELGLDRSNARKYVLKSGVRPHKRRRPDSGSQLTLALTVEEADRIRAKRQEEGFLDASKAVTKEFGYFYVIRLVPELDPRRVKLGFADDVGSRLAQHRTAAPTAALVKQWPCKRAWEVTVIDCLAAGCRLILNEVYECEDITGLLARADQFFGLLPAPAEKMQLSEHSPHNT
jgi:hypothetical protein